jgi:hypothetical protein
MADWETNRSMHPGLMLRARQIRRASQHLVEDKTMQRQDSITIA